MARATITDVFYSGMGRASLSIQSLECIRLGDTVSTSDIRNIHLDGIVTSASHCGNVITVASLRYNARLRFNKGDILYTAKLSEENPVVYVEE